MSRTGTAKWIIILPWRPDELFPALNRCSHRHPTTAPATRTRGSARLARGTGVGIPASASTPPAPRAAAVIRAYCFRDAPM